MFGFIVGILFIITGIVGCVWLCARDEGKYSAIPIAVGTVLGIACILLSCITSVATGHTGVLTKFGEVQEETFDAGLHFKAPWISVIEMDNRVQKETIELSCFSSDIQEVTCSYAINYQINKANAQELYKSVGKDYYDTAIVPNVSESVKTIMAHYTAEELVGNRDTLASSIEKMLGEELGKYNIEVVSTAIEDLDFTDTFTNAVEAKQVAAQQKLKAEIEQAQAVKQAEADAQVAKTKALAEAEVAKTKANADAEIAKIKAEADMQVAQIGADSAEYQGRKEAAIALQRLASINGWTVVVGENGVNGLVKANGEVVNEEELEAGAKKYLEWQFLEAWDGKYPEYYMGEGNVSTILGVGGIG